MAARVAVVAAAAHDGQQRAAAEQLQRPSPAEQPAGVGLEAEVVGIVVVVGGGSGASGHRDLGGSVAVGTRAQLSHDVAPRARRGVCLWDRPSRRLPCARVRALVFGVTPEPWSPPPGAGRLAGNLAVTPVALREVPDARPLRPDWLVTRPLLTGVCGSDSKQILLDFGEDDSDSAMSGFCSFPQVMGHEVVAEVVELGPAGQRLRRRAAGGAQPLAVLRHPGDRSGVPGLRGR